MGESTTAENTLFEVLALRLGLVDEQSLRESLRGGPPGPGSLGEWLVQLGQLSDVDRARVEALAGAAIERHGGDAAAACAELERSVVVPGLVLDTVAGQEASLDTVAPPPLPGDSVSSKPLSRRGGPRYMFSRLHAQGGLGQVWVAVDQDLKREVALKEIRSEVAENQEVRRRFLREAEITGQLEHPNIVPVYELGRRPEDGRPFYTMRFVRGRTLRDAIAEDRRRRASGEADPLARLKLLQAFATVCQAIAFAHDRGVVHRDLKPGNVVLGPFGEVVVLDWGLAKRVSTDDEGKLDAPVDPEAPADATQAGSLLGTPAYMAPEQAEGRVDAIDARTDVYGLGAVLFEILTGRPPYAGTKTEELIRAITTGPAPRPRLVDPSVPRPLDAVCARAMERDPADRYASALDLAREIDRYLADEPVTACREPLWDRARRWVGRHRLGVTVAAAIFLTLGPALAAEQFLVRQANEAKREAEKREDKLREQRTEAQQARNEAQLRRDAAQKLQEEAERREKQEAQAARYSQLRTRLRSRDETRVGWSAAALAGLKDLARVDTPIRDPLDLRNEAAAVFTRLDLTDPREFAKGVVAHSVAFGPGDATVAVSQFKTNVLGKCSLILADLGPGGTARTRSLDLSLLQMRKPGATGLFAPVVQDGLRGVAFSPDGRWLVAGTRGGSLVRWDLSAANPTPEKWPAHPVEVETVLFTPDSRRVFSQGNDRRVVAWDVAAGWKEAGSLPGSVDWLAIGGGFDGAPARLYVSGGGDVTAYDPATLQPVDRLAFDAGRIAASRDGRYLAGQTGDTVTVVATETHLKVSTLGAAGRALVQEGPLSTLAMSPDGSLVATACSTNADHRLRVWDAVSGRPLLEREIESEEPIVAVFSGDGARLAVTEDRVTRVYTLAGLKFARAAAPASGPVFAVSLHPAGGEDSIATLIAASYQVQQAARRLGLASARADRPGRVVEVGPASTLDVTTILMPLPAPGSYAFNDAAGRLLALDPGAKEPRVILDGPVSTLTVSPDGREVWGVVDEKEVRSWSFPNFQQRTTWQNSLGGLIGGRGQIYRLAVGEQYVLAGLRDGIVVVLKRSNGQPELNVVTREKLAGQIAPDEASRMTGAAVFGAAVSPARNLAALGSQDGKLQLKELSSGAATTLDGHTGSIRGVAFAEGGRLLVSGSSDGTIRLWRVEGKTATPWFTLQSPGGPVESLAVSPDGATLIALCRREHAVRFWDLARLRQEMTALGLEAAPPGPNGPAPAL